MTIRNIIWLLRSRQQINLFPLLLLAEVDLNWQWQARRDKSVRCYWLLQGRVKTKKSVVQVRRY